MVLSLVLLLSACFGKEDELPQAQYAFGPMETEGVLTSTGVSLMRRGTHVLSKEGNSYVYLESPKVSLREFHGKNVKVSGVLQQNVRKEFLPVLVVSGVTLLSAESDMKEVSVAGLSMTLDLPSSWTSSVTANGLTVTVPGSSTPLLKVTRDALLEREPQGVPLRVGGRSAIRTDAQSGLIREVFIRENAASWIRFTFTLSPSEEKPEERWAEFNALLASVRFGSSSTSQGSSSVSPLSGTGALPQQCGGPAGLLCPSGFYCRITNPAENIGMCTRNPS